MPRALQMITQRTGGRRVPTYMHPEMFAPRAVRSPDRTFLPMEQVASVGTLTGNGADVVITREEKVVADGMFFVSGEIPRVSGFERGFPGQHRLNNAGQWEPDELLMDERYVAVQIAGKGQFIFTACSHAGLVNVLTAARSRFPDVPIYGVMGGFHLSGSTEAIIPQTVEGIAQFGMKVIAAGHCTGWRALSALTAAYGDAVVPTGVGKRFML